MTFIYFLFLMFIEKKILPEIIFLKLLYFRSVAKTCFSLDTSLKPVLFRGMYFLRFIFKFSFAVKSIKKCDYFLFS